MLEIYSDFRFLVGEETIFFRQVVGQFWQPLYIIQRKIKLDRRKSASAVKVEIENELRISLHVDTIRNRAHEARLFGRVARQKALRKQD